MEDFAALECCPAQFALNTRNLEAQIAMLILGQQYLQLRHVLIEFGNVALQFIEEVRRLGAVGFLCCRCIATSHGDDVPPHR